MKKIILTLFLSLSLATSLHAILPDGISYKYLETDVRAFQTYEIEDEPNGYGEFYTMCIGGTLYIKYYDTLTFSHNPLTNEPYYCSVEKHISNEKNMFGNSQNKIMLTIHHKYPQNN